MQRFPPAGADDEEVARVLGGADDPDVLRWLYDRHAPWVYGYLRGVLADDAAAEDVLQEVFLALWRALPRYDPHLGPVRAWLMAMARSRAVDQLRRRARERLHAAGPVDAAVGELAADEAVGDDRHLDRASVRAAMRDLPPDQRRALYLVYFLGLSQSEAARRLLVPLGTLKGRIRLSVGRLRRLFDAGPRGR